MKQGLKETLAKWRASGAAQWVNHWKGFWRPDPNSDVDLRSDILSSTKGVQSALLQAEDIMKQIDEAAEELYVQVRSDVCHGACGLGCQDGGVPGVWGAWVGGRDCMGLEVY